MRYVSELYGRHPDSDIYVVGTGASLRVIDRTFFDNKIVISLNMAWKLVPSTYGITIHPDLNIPEFMKGERSHPEITWVTGHQKSRQLLSGEQLQYAEKNFFFFEYHGKPNTQPSHEPSDSGRELEWVRKPTGNYLYVWSSIAQAGANLAANLGAKNVILVGCDNCAILSNHHSHSQHTRWNGVDPEHRYRQYREGLSEVRTALRGRGVNLLSLNPFMGLAEVERDFKTLCRELGRNELIPNEDISLIRRQKNGWRARIAGAIQTVLPRSGR